MAIREDIKAVTVTLKMNVRRGIMLDELLCEIRDAVECWGGQRHPEDDLFYGISITKLKASNGPASIEFDIDAPRKID